MVSIRRVLAQIKDDWSAVLSEAHLIRVCREAGATWRHRTLTPVVTIYVFLLQVLHGNTAMTHLPRLSGKRFTPAAYCQARQRLPLAALRRLLQETGLPLRAGAGHGGVTPGAGTWRGHRTWLLDGSSCSMPDTPALQRRFGQPSAAGQPRQRLPLARAPHLAARRLVLLHARHAAPAQTLWPAHRAEVRLRLPRRPSAGAV
jgi:8-oxo-dGTP pyrophosphatase MutT (NUDIX family)